MDAKSSSVHTISKHTIKPSSPTPSHLKTLKLSLLDQLAPKIHIPLVFFYEADESKQLTTKNRAQISQKLKQSLSETLTLFYPLAGELNQKNFTVDCNDNGVEYTEARVRTRLADVIQNPIMEELKEFIPMDPIGGLSVLLAVKVSFFDCGGIGIGVCLSHQIADGKSTISFVNAWGVIFRGEKAQTPGFDLGARQFPARPLSGHSISPAVIMAAKDKVVTKRFLFDKEKLTALKETTISSSSSNVVKDPTRVELVSAFIWKHCMNEKWKGEKILAASHAVNLRQKSNSLVQYNFDDLENVFGNYYLTSVALHENEGDYVPEVDHLVRKLRDAIRIIDDEYIRNAQSGNDYLGEIVQFFSLLSKGEIELVIFSSWCRFLMYDVDYGWGKPVWVGTTTLPLNNTVILTNTKCGDDIEAWVNMVEDNTQSFDTQFKSLGTKT